jgi:thiol-disulfide isomerase/thioredoxin/uncharacterized protein YjbI with pentapeptide repeats
MSPRSIAGFTLAVILHVSSGSAQTRDDGWYSLDGDFLGVGDPAPGLMVQEFVRGEAVAEFERGKVYVIEFWKCGCPPCRAAIPHLNELQKKYPAVIFIGVGVITSPTDNKEYVKKSGDHLAYRVAIDRVPAGQDASVGGAMVLGWLEPAGYEGVPTTFVIDGNGRIAWIGHPMDLDAPKAGKPLEQVVSGTWDSKAAARSVSRSWKTEAVRRRIDRLPERERDALEAIQKRARKVTVAIRRNTVTEVSFSRARVTDPVIADLAKDLKKLEGLEGLDLCSTEITDAGLKTLRGLTTLRHLDLSCTRVTDVGLGALHEWHDLRILNLRGSHVTDAGLKELRSMKRLQTLILSGTHLTGAGLKQLAAIPELHVLDLSHTGITDVALGELRGMGELHGLNLSNTRITDAGLKELKGMKLGALWLENTQVEGSGLEHVSELVESLELSGTRVADAGLSDLKRFPNLRKINLNRTRVTDAGLLMLRGNRRLRVLNLADTRLTDAGLRGLHEMKDLEILGLSGTGVTNDGLNGLKHSRKLTFLDVARTKVTKAGVVDLRVALPDLEIGWSTGSPCPPEVAVPEPGRRGGR